MNFICRYFFVCFDFFHVGGESIFSVSGSRPDFSTIQEPLIKEQRPRRVLLVSAVGSVEAGPALYCANQRIRRDRSRLQSERTTSCPLTVYLVSKIDLTFSQCQLLEWSSSSCGCICLSDGFPDLDLKVDALKTN